MSTWKFKCPKCGFTHFEVPVVKIETWVVDEDGEYEDYYEGCDYDPVDERCAIWACVDCGYEGHKDTFRYELAR